MIRTPEQIAAGIVSEKDDQVDFFKRATGISPQTRIPEHVIIARFGTDSDFFSLIHFGRKPWQFPDIPTKKGNYPSHLIAMRLDATPELVEASLKLGVKYDGRKNKIGQTALDLALHQDRPGVAAAIEKAMAVNQKPASDVQVAPAPQTRQARQPAKLHGQGHLPF